MVDVVPLLAALERSDYRMTEPRRTVAALVADQPGHFAAADLVEARGARDLDVGRATIFRTLDVMLELGLVERLDLPVRRARLRRLRTAPPPPRGVLGAAAAREDIDDARAAARSSATSHDGPATAIDAHRLELFGLCPDCQAARRA